MTHITTMAIITIITLMKAVTWFSCISLQISFITLSMASQSVFLLWEVILIVVFEKLNLGFRHTIRYKHHNRHSLA